MHQFKRFPKNVNQNIISKFDQIADHFSQSASSFVTNDEYYLVGGPGSSLSNLQWLFKNKKNFINIDKGYFSTRKKNSHWRFTVNSLQQNVLINYNNQKIDQFNISLRQWKNSGDYIIILAPSCYALELYCNHTDIQRWCDEIKAKILQYTDRKIFVRFKDNKKQRDPLLKYLDNCYATVGLQTLGSIESIVNGVPSINIAPSCLDILHNDKIENIENLSRPDNRYEWLNCLANNQFTLDEMKNGTALQAISRFM